MAQLLNIYFAKEKKKTANVGHLKKQGSQLSLLKAISSHGVHKKTSEICRSVSIKKKKVCLFLEGDLVGAFKKPD